MKTEISINIEDLANLFEKAELALHTVQELCRYDLFTKDDYYQDRILLIKSLGREAANLPTDTIGQFSRHLDLAHRCAKALSCTGMLADRWNLPEPDYNDPQSVRDCVAKANALECAERFSDYE